ncbi:TPA: hypothetical protein N3F83_004224 [Klebsiella variicola subsp. variicola]|uniref:hypothetical protein n=1 Tax=Klebsiella variicola TaxID=244366 RepID=UPI000BDC0FD9|nr:hypothetical protein CQA02_24735 [Klebsiella variicola]HCA4367951.1 hypothetical protein [Klebsiella variicola subsp. variicola]HCM3146096.1 hypothetical protein [Klebsiella variicola subsp. variicola]HCM6005954.1 hypothetical protein [Klebsiella quasipneumoniae]
MREKGLIFNSEMVRAILDGRKTQTRRPIKWKQTRFTEIGEREGGRRWPWSEDAEHACDFWHPCPFGAVGDRIWVRETFCPVDDTQYGGEKWVDYRATPKFEASHPAGWDCAPNDAEALKWRPSIHMPRWASRILLEITNVRVERLNAISEEDVDAEGFAGDYPTSVFPNLFPGEPKDWSHLSMRDCYGVLWKSIYGEESWKANPWVWVIEFKRVEGGAA